MVFEILKNQRRRRVLDLLLQQGGRSTLSDLAERIAAEENGIERQAITSDQRKRVYVGLYQRHLPKMDDVGFVDFDQRSGDVVLTDLGEELCTYSTWPETGGTTWPKRHLGVGTAGLVALFAAWGNVLPVGPTMVVVLGALALLSVAHVREWTQTDATQR